MPREVNFVDIFEAARIYSRSHVDPLEYDTNIDFDLKLVKGKRGKLTIDHHTYDTEIIGVIKKDMWFWGYEVFPEANIDVEEAIKIFRDNPEWPCSNDFIESGKPYNEKHHLELASVITYLAKYDFMTVVDHSKGYIIVLMCLSTPQP